MRNYDALLLVSFGGPEKPSDVIPFLENVTRGRGIPKERLEAVAEHYYHFGGKSPINDENRALIALLAQDLESHGVDLPIYFGNRNWAPLLSDTVAEMTRAGVKNALALITSAYSSYSSCRQYLGDIEAARAANPGAPEIEPLRRFFNHPGFLDACTARVGAARAELEAVIGSNVTKARLVYTAHSIPKAMADRCDYEKQLSANAALISERLGHAHWDLVWQSRSGAPEVPWLEPDILDHLRVLAREGTAGVVIAPIGFLCDHVEVLYDLDYEARLLCEELKLPMARAATVGTHPDFVACLRELVLERIAGTAPASVGPFPARPFPCAPDCCPRPMPPVRLGTPAGSRPETATAPLRASEEARKPER